MGKTTLLKIILGEDGNFEGAMEISSGLSIRSIPQELPPTEESLFEYVISSFPQSSFPRCGRWNRKFTKDLKIKPF